MAALFSLALSRVPVVGVYLMPPVFLICGYVVAHIAQRKHSDVLRLLGIKQRSRRRTSRTPRCWTPAHS